MGRAGLESRPQVKKQLEASRGRVGGRGDKGSPELSSRKLTIRRDKEKLLFIDLLLPYMLLLYAIAIFGVCAEKWNGGGWCLGEGGLEERVTEPIRKSVGGTASRVCLEMVEQLQD